ncbi:hypothetical protein EG68_07599 [Paragonimus skrjabini miyazakii]|uniref:Sodium/myo-inositol cotransporter n=1 Tax=Paragonimus skrjabini miyazakii TaxID=59628 RepID=A0A8S9YDW7_9TREM|nr:hypothetical protein EG68_07599 [Paragonimus skrjabini miyazakii]
MSSDVRIDGWDISVLVVYLFGVVLTGLIAMFASKRDTLSGFFLAGRFISWLPVGASLFASNIGSEHFIGVAGSGAVSGIGVGAFELNASILLQLLGWVFLPVYIASGVCTLPEYMRKRFGGKRIQVYLAGLSLLLYVLTKISVNLYSGSLFLTEALHWNIWPSVILILILTTLITVTGGMAAVLYTDTLQCFVMVVGAILLASLSFIRVGGFAGLLASYGQAIASIDLQTADSGALLLSLANVTLSTNITSRTELAAYPGMDPSLGCSLPSPKAFRLLREVDDPDMPWLGFILGQTPASIWYWCADQMMVQRVLAAKSLSHAQGGTLMAGVIKQLPLFVMVIPGMISRILYADEVACVPGNHCLRICGQRGGCSNLAYPKLVVNLMPSGLRGLMLAVMLAALISDLTSIFNSSSTLFTVDIYGRFRKGAKESELMLVGRLFVIILVAISIGWIPVVQGSQGSQLYLYIQSVSACLAPPIAAVYLVAILWWRANEPGTFYSLVYGLLIGLIRLVLTIVYSEPVCGEVDNRPWLVSKFHYMYFALLSFASTILVMVVISLLSKPPEKACIQRLTYFTAWNPQVLSKGILNEESVSTQITNTDVVRASFYSTNDPRSLTKNCAISHDDSTGGVVLSESAVDTKCGSAHAEVIDPQCFCKCESRLGVCVHHSLRWLCGCEDRPCPAADEKVCLRALCCCKSVRDDDFDEVDNISDDYAARLQIISSLDQDARAKLGLRVGLVAIIILSVFAYVFFSVYFDLVEAGPFPIKTYANATLPTNITDALDTLLRFGIVRLV